MRNLAHYHLRMLNCNTSSLLSSAKGGIEVFYMELSMSTLKSILNNDLLVGFAIGIPIGGFIRLWLCHWNWSQFMNPFYPWNLLIN